MQQRQQQLQQLQFQLSVLNQQRMANPLITFAAQQKNLLQQMCSVIPPPNATGSADSKQTDQQELLHGIYAQISKQNQLLQLFGLNGLPRQNNLNVPLNAAGENNSITNQNHVNIDSLVTK
jgi:hypothetical protein